MCVCVRGAPEVICIEMNILQMDDGIDDGIVTGRRILRVKPFAYSLRLNGLNVTMLIFLMVSALSFWELDLKANANAYSCVMSGVFEAHEFCVICKTNSTCSFLFSTDASLVVFLRNFKRSQV